MTTRAEYEANGGRFNGPIPAKPKDVLNTESILAEVAQQGDILNAFNKQAIAMAEVRMQAAFDFAKSINQDKSGNLVEVLRMYLDTASGSFYHISEVNK